MNRQIKFRAWDIKRKKYWSADEMGKDQLTLSPDGKGFINVNGISTSLSTYLTHLIPEQFTGLKDKNEKEIYEGDLLRFPADIMNDKENYVIYEVFWDNNDCADNHIGFQMNKTHFAGNLCGTSFFPGFLPKNVSKMEIIGNIHDNPELLEAK